MIDRATNFAQRIADGMSRRGFLGRVGAVAAIAAAACGGILALIGKADAYPGQPCSATLPCPQGEVCTPGGRCRPVTGKKKKGKK